MAALSSQSCKNELEYTPIGALFQFHIHVAQRLNLCQSIIQPALLILNHVHLRGTVRLRRLIGSAEAFEFAQLPALILNHSQSCGTVRLRRLR